MASLSDFKVNAAGTTGGLSEVDGAPSAPHAAPEAVGEEAVEVPTGVRQPSPPVPANLPITDIPTPKITDDYAKVDKQTSLKAKGDTLTH